MIVTIRGQAHACRAATAEKGTVTLYLGEYDEKGKERTSVFVGFPAHEIIGLEAKTEPGTEEVLNALLGVTV